VPGDSQREVGGFLFNLNRLRAIKKILQKKLEGRAIQKLKIITYVDCGILRTLELTDPVNNAGPGVPKQNIVWKRE